MEYSKTDIELFRHHLLAKKKSFGPRCETTRKLTAFCLESYLKKYTNCEEQLHTEVIVPKTSNQRRRAPKMEIYIQIVNVFLVVLLSRVTTASPIQSACDEPLDSQLNNLLTADTHESFAGQVRFDHVHNTNDIEFFRNISTSILAGERRQCIRSGISSDIREASTCPWHYVFNVDPNRRPVIIVESKCNCRHHRPCIGGVANSHCEPVKYNIRVLRKYGCEGGTYLYRQTMERITVGCTCVIRN